MRLDNLSCIKMLPITSNHPNTIIFMQNIWVIVLVLSVYFSVETYDDVSCV